MKRHRPVRKTSGTEQPEATEITPLRIIGGSLARRRLKYSGDARTRPMKDRIREAVFNLVGPAVAGKHTIDLFAGTGALGLEAISRGAARATFVEQHFPTAAIIRENIATLGLGDITQVIPANVFIWARRLPDLGPEPWLVFCSPPWAFYAERSGDMHDLLARLLPAAPPGSIFVIDADQSCDMATLPAPSEWDVRDYPPARIAILRT